MTRKELIAIADRQNAAYPQYHGHFDNYVLVRIKRKVTTKMGVAFDAGELAIARPNNNRVPTTLKERDTVTVYSVNNECDTSVFKTDVEFLELGK